MNLETIRTAASKIREGMDLLSNGPLDYYLTELAAAHELLLTRFAPFKVGERVQLAITPTIIEETAPGWMHSRHYLVKGSAGRVKTVECGSGGFRFFIEFDDETWIDRDGVKRPVSSKHVYCFRENEVERMGMREGV